MSVTLCIGETKEKFTKLKKKKGENKKGLAAPHQKV